MDGLILTREALLRIAGIKPDKELRRAHRAIKQAHRAVRTVSVEDHREGAEAGDRLVVTEPDHPTRLRAADLNLKLIDAYPKDSVGSDPSRPVAVNIILDGATHGAGPALSSHGVTLHLTEHHGDGA